MSGNLKILVHKSWHVWKRENREKVARDERNFREENEKKDERQKSLLQEKNMELLQSESHRSSLPHSLGISNNVGTAHQIIERSTGDHTTEEIKEEISIDTPFRLFGDIEQLDKKAKEERDRVQAKKEKELQDKKKSGEAPWALGEGAAEKIGQTRFETITLYHDMPLNIIPYSDIKCSVAFYHIMSIYC